MGAASLTAANRTHRNEDRFVVATHGRSSIKRHDLCAWATERTPGAHAADVGGRRREADVGGSRQDASSGIGAMDFLLDNHQLVGSEFVWAPFDVTEATVFIKLGILESFVFLFSWPES